MRQLRLGNHGTRALPFCLDVPEGARGYQDVEGALIDHLSAAGFNPRLLTRHGRAVVLGRLLGEAVDQEVLEPHPDLAVQLRRALHLLDGDPLLQLPPLLHVRFARLLVLPLLEDRLEVCEDWQGG